MSCFHPVQAYKPRAGGQLLFSDRGDCDPIKITCKQCIGCRLGRSCEWAMRCMHEMSLHEANCFLTLTYDDAHLPFRGQLDYPEFVRFMKRLRFYADAPGVRFYMCGEYGELNWRPHYHACIFGFDFSDKSFFGRSVSGDKLCTSDALSRLWPHGFASVGALNFQSAAYTARYCVTKVTGDYAPYWYARKDSAGAFQLIPEFNHMSLRPGVAAGWFEKYHSDVLPRDYVVMNGVKCPVPKYYDRLFAVSHPVDMAEIKSQREYDAYLLRDDNTPERLAVKEIVQRARSSMLIRSVV